jgi:SPX domain protein involved in polyphosphate accumulation
MNIDQAKKICKAHVKYVLEDIPNDYTPEEIGIAIDVISDIVRHYSVSHSDIISTYNLWRRGDILNYPNNSVYNMEILKESVLLV